MPKQSTRTNRRAAQPAADLGSDLQRSLNLLRDECKRMLDERRGDWKKIAQDKKSGVSYSWISKFTNDKIERPQYDRLSTLYAWLLKHPVKPA